MARKRYQTGSLKLRGDKWTARWREDVIMLDNQIHRVRRSCVLGDKKELPTEKLARRRFDLLLAKVNAPGYRPGRVATLAEFVERWREIILPQRKESTRKAAQSHLRAHILPQLGAMRLDQLGKENVQAFVTNLSACHSRKTVVNVLGTFASIVGTAKEWGYICEPVNWRSVALPPEGLKKPERFFSAEEARGIIAGAQEPFGTMFAIAAMSAIRPGELCGLKVEDLDFERNLIFVRRSAYYGKLQTPKTKRSVGVLPMPERLKVRLEAYLKTWRPNPAGLLFATFRGKPICANQIVQRKLWPILDRLGIERAGLKAFRHTHSSLLIAVGAPPTVAQAQLRHTDARTTLGIYSHVMGDGQREAVEKVAELLDPVGLTVPDKAKWLQ